MDDLKNSLKSLIYISSQELVKLGDKPPEENKVGFLNGLLRDFMKLYEKLLKGPPSELSSTELQGGARIRDYFETAFPKLLEKLNSKVDEIVDERIAIRIKNANGELGNSRGLVPDVLSGCLKECTNDWDAVEKPVLECISTIQQMLQQFRQQILNQPMFSRFPKFRKKVDQDMNQILDKTTSATQNHAKIMIKSFNYLYFPSVFEKQVITEDKTKTNNNNTPVGEVKTWLKKYLLALSQHLLLCIPKLIFYFMVEETQREVIFLAAKYTDETLVDETDINRTNRIALMDLIHNAEECLTLLYSL